MSKPSKFARETAEKIFAKTAEETKALAASRMYCRYEEPTNEFRDKIIAAYAALIDQGLAELVGAAATVNNYDKWPGMSCQIGISDPCRCHACRFARLAALLPDFEPGKEEKDG